MTVAGRELPSQQAFQHVFVLAALAAVGAGLVALAIPRRARPNEAAGAQDTLRPNDAEELVASGRVLDRAGRPVARAVVSVATLDGEAVDWARTGVDGSFAVAVPEWGRFVLVASATGWASTVAVTELQAGAGPTELILDQPVRLGGHVLGAPEGATVTLVDEDGQVCGATRTDEVGAYAFTLPAPGRYVVAAVDADDAAAVDVLVGSGPMRVDLRLATRAQR